MKTAVTYAYTFNPAAKTVDLSSISGFDVKKLYAIINTTANQIIFANGQATYGLASVAGSVITLLYNTTAMNAADKLTIIYDDPTAVQAISAASLPLPTGAASETTLSSLLTESSDFTASGTITTQNLNPTGVATANSSVAVSVSGKGTVTIQVSGTYTGALSPQVTTNGTVWVTQANASLQNMANGAVSSTITSGSTGIWQTEVNGHAQFRISANAVVTGTATITLRSAQGTSQVSISGGATSALQTTGNASLSSIDTKVTGLATESTLGNVSTNTLATANNTSSINSKLPVQGQAVMSASVPVVLASNQSAIPITGTVTTGATQRSKVALVRNDYSSVNVTTGAYVQLIASTSAQATRLEIFDSSGQTLVLAVGASSSEIDQFYINPGGNGIVDLLIPSGSRISIKAVTASATAGYINLTLYS